VFLLSHDLEELRVGDTGQEKGLLSRLPNSCASRGRILGRNRDKNLKSFPPCYSQSPLLTDFTPPPPSLSKSALKLVCNGNIVYGNLKAGNSQDYDQKTQRNCTLINSASGLRGSFMGRSSHKQFSLWWHGANMLQKDSLDNITIEF
jgi:hypothetical protein